MMYISVYPVVITMRNSNVYEERSLGLYSEDEYERRRTRTSSQGLGFMRTLTDHLVPDLSTDKQSNGQFVRHQLRAQLAHDAWTIVVALFFIMIIEGSQFSQDPAVFSVFNFLFEIVSAYGCVGISVGIPTENYSFCGSWHVLSKLILCVVMLRGRHRGLPVAIDQAVLLPGDRNAEAEEDDGRIRRARSASRGTRSEVA
jgi:Trk-type K+ transport system membrane component